jgi:hypothetical protein
MHICSDEMWWQELEAAGMVGDTRLEDYLSIDDDLPTRGVELPSTDNAFVPDTLNDEDDDEDDPMPLGSELSDIQVTEMIVQMRNFIATKDNAQRHIVALSNALDYIDEAPMKAKKQKKITKFFHI